MPYGYVLEPGAGPTRSTKAAARKQRDIEPAASCDIGHALPPCQVRSYAALQVGAAAAKRASERPSNGNFGRKVNPFFFFLFLCLLLSAGLFARRCGSAGFIWRP